jgi:tetratricopeptide (TPR) repeat protein
LGQLGNLYKKLGRLEEAINFYRQSGELYRRLGDLSGEGKTRSNLADAFIKHKRYDEARQELQRAIETLSPCGHASESWKAWSVLEGLERSTGRAEGARAARSKAIEAYLAYRHAGGVSQSPAAQLFAQAAQALQQGSDAEMQQQLIALLEPNDPQHFTALVRQLQAVLSGNRNSALAEDLELDYANAAELQLLLESLQLN